MQNIQAAEERHTYRQSRRLRVDRQMGWQTDKHTTTWTDSWTFRQTSRAETDLWLIRRCRNTPIKKIRVHIVPLSSLCYLNILVAGGGGQGSSSTTEPTGEWIKRWGRTSKKLQMKSNSGPMEEIVSVHSTICSKGIMKKIRKNWRGNEDWDNNEQDLQNTIH